MNLNSATMPLSVRQSEIGNRLISGELVRHTA